MARKSCAQNKQLNLRFQCLLGNAAYSCTIYFISFIYTLQYFLLQLQTIFLVISISFLFILHFAFNPIFMFLFKISSVYLNFYVFRFLNIFLFLVPTSHNFNFVSIISFQSINLKFNLIFPFYLSYFNILIY